MTVRRNEQMFGLDYNDSQCKHRNMGYRCNLTVGHPGRHESSHDDFIEPMTWVSENSDPTDNPKATRAAAENKAPMDLLPWGELHDVAQVMKHGADKYGIRNWRQDEIKCSTYVGSTIRHVAAWAMGEDLDPDSGYHHLTHAIAGLLIVLDAKRHNTLIDDRHFQESKG